MGGRLGSVIGAFLLWGRYVICFSVGWEVVWLAKPGAPAYLVGAKGGAVLRQCNP